MESKLFDEPHSHTPEWYATLEMADHLHQPGHRERLLWTLSKAIQIILAAGRDIQTVADWGCGNGGLLSEIKHLFPHVHAWGYDLLPANVDHAKKVYGFDQTIVLMDFVNNASARGGNLTILTEVLEHMVDPRAVLRRLHAVPQVGWILASSPAFETKEEHYEHHLWTWDTEGYRELFRDCGWNPVGDIVFAGATILAATR